MFYLQDRQIQTYIIKRTGDMFFLIALTTLMKAIVFKKQRLVSGKTFAILLITFLLRYQFFIAFDQSTWLVVIQRLYVVVCYAAITFTIFSQKMQRNQNQYDSFNLLILVCLVILAVMVWPNASIPFILSYFFEGLAYLPQIWMIDKSKRSSKIITQYFMMIAIWKFIYFSHAKFLDQTNCPSQFEECRLKFVFHLFICLISLCAGCYSFIVSNSNKLTHLSAYFEQQCIEHQLNHCKQNLIYDP